MMEQDASPARLAADAIRERLCGRVFTIDIGPEGDYLRIMSTSTPRPDISVSLIDLPLGDYSVQICLDGDPLHIVYDDICDLQNLLNLCDKYVDESIG